MNFYWLGYTISDNILMLMVLIGIIAGIYIMIRVNNATEAADWQNRLNETEEKTRKRK